MAGHAHSTHGRHARPASPRARRLLAGLLVPAVVATLVGLLVLWPGGGGDDVQVGTPTDVIDATVVGLRTGPCAGTELEQSLTCTVPTVRLGGGPERGDEVDLAEISEGSVRLEVGDEVVLGYYRDAPEGFEYSL
ncbi:MAG: hypothetical protein AB7V15_06110, partial [Acidimicrobiia bacterium]